MMAQAQGGSHKLIDDTDRFDELFANAIVLFLKHILILNIVFPTNFIHCCLPSDNLTCRLREAFKITKQYNHVENS